MIKMCWNKGGPIGAQKLQTYLIFLVCLGLFIGTLGETQAQQRGGMEVAERDEAGRAIRFNFNFTSQELKNLFEWMSREAELSIMASENDVRGKSFSLINVKNVTTEEVIEKIKTVLAQYELTLVQSDSIFIVTTFEKAIVMNVPVKRIAPDPEQVEITDEIHTYIIQLENAVASEQVASLKPLLNRRANIFADSMTNALVITDVASNVRRIASILQFADTGERFPLKVAIIPLTYADAETLEQTLTKVFGEDGQDDKSSQGTKGIDAEQIKAAIEQGIGVEMIPGQIKVYADTNSNSLILKATEENLIVLKEIIRHLDTAPSVQTEIRTYHLNYASADDVSTTLEEIITGESQRGSGSYDRWDREKMRIMRRERGETGSMYQGIVGTVNVSKNDRLNIVVVSSDPRNFPIIEKIIQSLDQAQTQEEIKIYFLEYANAEDLSAELQDLFEGGSAGSDRDRPWWERRDREPTRDSSFGVQGNVHIIHDVRLNALLISTASQNFPMIDNLIKQLDVNMPDQEWGTRIFYLRYADAQNVANLINTHYQGQSNQSSSRRSYYYYDFYYLRNRQSSSSQTQGALAGNVSAEPYVNLNAIIVSTGTKRNFDMIEEFIKQVDIPTPPEQVEITDIVRLEYANAEALAQVLAQVWQDPEAEGEGFGFSFSRYLASQMSGDEPTDINSLHGKVTIYADASTNSLIITTRRRYMEEVKALIKQLDFVRGQVRIDIQILEITLDETTKLGIELAAQENKLFGVELAPGNPLVGTANSQLGLEQEISGFNYGLATKEYMALLHTLIRENKVQTLSTPSILTRDSQQATWSSGRRIPYLQSVDTNSILGETATQPLFNYDFIDPPVGINIDLTPFIAKSQAEADGKRTIGLQITNISASNFIEFTEFNAPITDDNSLSTYVDVEDGQQLIVGGIIRQKQKQVENKVPILGDIPLLGRLFKSTETEVQNTEIVFIITPHIIDIKNPGDLEKKQSDLERLRKKADSWQNNGMNGERKPAK